MFPNRGQAEDLCAPAYYTEGISNRKTGPYFMPQHCHSIKRFQISMCRRNPIIMPGLLLPSTLPECQTNGRQDSSPNMQFLARHSQNCMTSASNLPLCIVKPLEFALPDKKPFSSLSSLLLLLSPFISSRSSRLSAFSYLF